MNKEESPPGVNFASGAVCHTIVFKFSAFYFIFGQKLAENLVLKQSFLDIKLLLHKDYIFIQIYQLKMESISLKHIEIKKTSNP